MMGFDSGRFECEVSSEFTCIICSDVLEDPLIIPQCEHVYCKICIRDWLKDNPNCPIDRNPATKEILRPPLRSFRNLLNALNIRCEFKGCDQYVKLQNLNEHLKQCLHNPENKEKEFYCHKDCGALIKVQQKDQHDCVAYLKKEIQTLLSKYNKETKQLTEAVQKWKEKYELIHKVHGECEEKILTLKQEIEYKNELNANISKQLEEEKEVNRRSNHILSNSNPSSPSGTWSSLTGRKAADTYNYMRTRSNQPEGYLVDVGDKFTYPVTTGIKSSSNLTSGSSRFYSQSSSNLTLLTRKSSNNSGGGGVNNGGGGGGGGGGNNSTNPFTHNTGLGTLISIVKEATKAVSLNGDSGAENESNNVDLNKVVREQCKNARVVQVLSLVNRRHFYPDSEYYKAVATKRGAHSFALNYEIELLEIIEPLINSESRVLDIGSGYGHLTVCIAQLCRFVVGIEHVKELVSKAREIVENNYRELRNRIEFYKEDGRHGCERFSPYDLILIEPMVRNGVTQSILNQLKPNGSVIAAIKSDSRIQLCQIKLDGKQTVTKTLLSNQQILSLHNKDILCDLKSQDTSIFNRFSGKNF